MATTSQAQLILIVVSSGVRGNSLSSDALARLLPLSSFGGVGGPECLLGMYSSFAGVGGLPSLLAVPESFGGVGGGLPCDWSLFLEREMDLPWSCGGPRYGAPESCGGGDTTVLFPFTVSEALLLLCPPTLDDSPASSTTGSVVPISPRSADGLRTALMWKLGTSSSV